VNFRRWFRRPRIAAGDPAPQRCQLCGIDLSGAPVCALVADPAVVRPAVPSLDGWRLLSACSPQHLTVLITAFQADA
jgi:hypothetical protein